MKVQLSKFLPKKLLSNKILNNKILLYVIYALSVIQLFHFLFLNRFDYIIAFALMAYIIFYFSNNITLVLGIPLVIITLKQFIFKEGFESSGNEKKSQSSGSGNGKPTKYSGSSNSASSSSESETSTITPLSSPEEETDNSADSKQEDSSDSASMENPEAEFNPNQINYATTMTDNMKMYNSVLGSDGFAKMTSDTQELLRQQEMLGRNMQQFAPMLQQMTPFLEKATQLLNGLDMKQLNAAAGMFKGAPQ